MDETTEQPPELLPHQQRVVDEKTELDARLGKLGAFIDGDSDIYLGLSVSERHRLQEQRYYMTQYSNILAARIGAFGV